MGSEGQEGLIADANAAIFARLTRCRHQVMVRVSFVEVYKVRAATLCLVCIWCSGPGPNNRH
jgi:hypothetical protein